MDFNWLWVIPVLGILIIVHEMGHFFTAIWLGIKVEEFGLGFPPRLFAIRRKGIDYSLNALPIGGFVKILGENGESDDPRSFGHAPAWKRIVVLSAGSLMNLLLALVIFTGMSVSGTREVDAPFTGVADVLQNQPAAKAGMLPGDRILSVGGREVKSSDEVRTLSKENAGKTTEYVVERDGKRISLTVTPNVNPPSGGYLGILLASWVSPVKVDTVSSGSITDKAGLKAGDVITEVDGKVVNNLPQFSYYLRQSNGSAAITVDRSGTRTGPLKLDLPKNVTSRSLGMELYVPYHMVYNGPLSALGRALGSTWDVVSSIPRGIAAAFAGNSQGPGVTAIVGIGQLTGEVAQEGGINGLLNLTALLGISLFMINLMPLPALDGGRLLFILIELFRGGRRVAPEKEGLVHFAGMVVLLTLMLIITFFDVQRLFQGTRLLP